MPVAKSSVIAEPVPVLEVVLPIGEAVLTPVYETPPTVIARHSPSIVTTMLLLPVEGLTR